METSWKEFSDRVQEGLKGFLEHRHAALAAAEAYDEAIDKLKPGEAIFLMDFGMNYSHVHGEEPQSDFWTHIQTTILPIVVYRKADDSQLGTLLRQFTPRLPPTRIEKFRETIYI